ncbi:MAG: type II toxin-antitoxin system VapC family toxin [Propionicimonas sp.]|uniref:type II toxin-antitoxin system VapC family toxin n=1 Tax=Propionicimonas sp. TaxID=1955623 RepID=UPI002B211370|nr:type II toxin-antitoxin system VapC family toxin [Propionicimonas sp.]MEA4945774.1 type II toxin-antitoxin system VapC family toxin [Propionicimonas sp.]MEA5054432.1 type II toxin-antitoxin system VapC family toxin [Propionicimonas sp.]
MIVDTSALVAVILGEPDAEGYLRAMATAESLAVSAATLVEALIVVEARQGRDAATDLAALLTELDAEIVSFDEVQAEQAAAAWRRFGTGRHPAALNFGDTFSYALAVVRGEALLFKGDDFAATDVMRA